jgi:hypothetical protein
MKKLTFLLVIGSLLVFSTPLVWGQMPTSAVVRTPAQFNDYLESLGLKLQDPQNCPPDYVTVKDGKNIFGTSVIGYSPADANRILEAYGLKLQDPQKCPPDFVTVKEGKNIFGTSIIQYGPGDGDKILEAYGVKTKK